MSTDSPMLAAARPMQPRTRSGADDSLRTWRWSATLPGMKLLNCVLLSAAILVGSCRDQSFTAAQCAALTSEKAIIKRCMGGDVHGGKGMLDDTRCFPFSAPTRMRGIRFMATERMKFFPDAMRFNESMRNDYSTWVESSSNFTSDVPQTEGDNDGAFLIEFVGRKSLCPWAYGHLNSYKNEVVIDHLISSKRVVVPPLSL